MKRAVSFVVLIAGIVLFALSRFVFEPGTITDWVMRVSGLLMMIGLVTVSYFTAKSVKCR